VIGDRETDNGFRVKMAMGMGFPIPMRMPCHPWESSGNWNKTPVWEWEREGMGKTVDRNGNDPWEKCPWIFFIVVDMQ